MAIALPLNDFHCPSFFNKNEEEEDEFQLFAEELQLELQLEEALNASASVAVRGESSMGFCELCWVRGEYDLLMKNGTCGHSVCLDCITKYVEENIKKGIKIVTCPGFNCDSVLKFDAFKDLLSEDLMLWEKALSMELIPNFSCSKRTYVKSCAEHVKQIVPKRKYEEATVSNIPMKTSYLPSLAIASSPWKDDQQNVSFNEEKNKPDLAAATANDDDIDNSDELADTDDYDPDASPRSPETCKKSKWFKKFMKELEYLSNEGKMDDPNRQWYCPVCQIGNGAGAIRRHLGLHTLIKHAKKNRSNRVRLHRELAQLLEQKLQTDKARSANPAAEEYAKLIGLKVGNKDREIVWPPMVVIANAFYKQDGTNNWILIKNQQLVDMFSLSYDCIVEAQNSYERMQHSGTSMLIFESSARGYVEAERLHKHFEEEGIGRTFWKFQAVDSIMGDVPQICGFLALKEDVDLFNPYLSKPKLKYEMRSYREMVVNRIRQMSDENHELVLLKKRVGKQEQQEKVLEECNSDLKEKLQIAMKEMATMRRKIIEHHQQKTEEMEFQEQFYKDLIRKILESRKYKEEQQENVEQCWNACPSQRYDDYAANIREEVTEPIKKQQKKKKIAESRKLMIMQKEMNMESARIKADAWREVFPDDGANAWGEDRANPWGEVFPDDGGIAWGEDRANAWGEVFPDDGANTWGEGEW